MVLIHQTRRGGETPTTGTPSTPRKISDECQEGFIKFTTLDEFKDYMAEPFRDGYEVWMSSADVVWGQEQTEKYPNGCFYGSLDTHRIEAPINECIEESGLDTENEVADK